MAILSPKPVISAWVLRRRAALMGGLPRLKASPNCHTHRVLLCEGHRHSWGHCCPRRVRNRVVPLATSIPVCRGQSPRPLQQHMGNTPTAQCDTV